MCAPCLVHFDWILRLEDPSLEQDSAAFLAATGMDSRYLLWYLLILSIQGYLEGWLLVTAKASQVRTIVTSGARFPATY